MRTRLVKLSGKVFLRDATGLVREFSALDSLRINLGTLGVWFTVTYVASTATLVGGEPFSGLILPLVGWFFIALAFSIVSIVAPRTAGDYVFTTRYLNPALGFVGNGGVFVILVPIAGIGITVVTLNSFSLSPLLAYWGLLMQNPSLISLATTLETNPVYEFSVGGILTIIFGLIPILGNRLFKALNRVVFPLVIISIVAAYAVLAVTPQTTALGMLNHLAGNSSFVDGVNAWGAANNSPAPGISIANTMSLNAVYGFGFGFLIMATYFAGEVRNVKKSMPFAIIGTLLICAVAFLLAIVLSYNAFGQTFLSNLYTQSILFASPPLPVVPYLDFLAAAITPNIFLGTFILLMPLLQMCWFQANGVFVGSRLLFSYSMDRILPSFFADVNDRFHVPVKAMLATLIIGLLGGILFVLPSAGVAFLLAGAAEPIEFLFPITVLGVAMLAFRFRHSKEFKESGLTNTYLGGPLYYVTAIVVIVFSLASFYQFVTIPQMFGYAGTEGLELIFGPIIILFILYYISKYINKRRGVPVDLIFKQIPPE